MLETVRAGICTGQNGTYSFILGAERWDPSDRHAPTQAIRACLAHLDSSHPAPGGRILPNHPQAIINPPYFDDL